MKNVHSIEKNIVEKSLEHIKKLGKHTGARQITCLAAGESAGGGGADGFFFFRITGLCFGTVEETEDEMNRTGSRRGRFLKFEK